MTNCFTLFVFLQYFVLLGCTWTSQNCFVGLTAGGNNTCSAPFLLSLLFMDALWPSSQSDAWFECTVKTERQQRIQYYGAVSVMPQTSLTDFINI